ncbi:MAG: hypothetical protein R3F01_10405 [Lysobacteraceae bacterium]
MTAMDTQTATSFHAFVRCLALCLLGLCSSSQAALILRVVTQPPAEVSSLSRFPVSFELYNTTTGLRIIQSGVPVNLALYRCPGYPASCSVVIVDTDLADANTVNGVVTFNNLQLDTNSDYYFYATSPGYTGVTSNVFDAVQAVIRLDAIPTEWSSLSRRTLTARIYRGAGGSAPIDPLASGNVVRLALYRCPGYPASCSVNIINTNYANANSAAGVATFNNVVVGTPNDDYYFYATTPSQVSTGDTSEVFDVDQAVIRLSTIPTEWSSLSRQSMTATIHRGPGNSAPLDSSASGSNIRLALYRCPGYPASCSVVIIDTNEANANSVAGVATFNNLAVETPATDYYYYATAPSQIATGDTSDVFDVVQAVIKLTDLPLEWSTLSRVPMTASIHRGPGSAPVDTTASGSNIRLALYRCPGYPSSCSVSVINTNFVNAISTNGLATFSNLAISTTNDDYYFYATTPSGVSTGSTSDVFDVETAQLHIEPSIPTQIAGVPFARNVVVRRGSGGAAPVDTHADNILVRLALYRCPGFPASCAVQVISSNFVQDVAHDGVAPFDSLQIDTAATDYYFFPTAPIDAGESGNTSSVFDVILDPVLFIDGFE